MRSKKMRSLLESRRVHVDILAAAVLDLVAADTETVTVAAE
jgi:hypothetical protein